MGHANSEQRIDSIQLTKVASHMQRGVAKPVFNVDDITAKLLEQNLNTRVVTSRDCPVQGGAKLISTLGSHFWRQCLQRILQDCGRHFFSMCAGSCIEQIQELSIV